MTDRLLTVTETAERLRRDPATVRRMIGRGELAAHRVGGRLLIPDEAIDQLLERTKVQPVVPGPRRSWRGGHVALPPSQTPRKSGTEGMSVREKLRQRREREKGT